MIHSPLFRFVRQHGAMITIVLLTIAVVWVALLVVNNQYKVRALISDIEQEQELSRRLLDEQREINIELAKEMLGRTHHKKSNPPA